MTDVIQLLITDLCVELWVNGIPVVCIIVYICVLTVNFGFQYENAYERDVRLVYEGQNAIHQMIG